VRNNYGKSRGRTRAVTPTPNLNGRTRDEGAEPPGGVSEAVKPGREFIKTGEKLAGGKGKGKNGLGEKARVRHALGQKGKTQHVSKDAARVRKQSVLEDIPA